MREKTLKTLEYYKILDILEKKAESDLGKSKVRNLRPMEDIDSIELAQEETEEAYKILVKRSNPPLFGIYNLEDEMRHLEIGGYLQPYSLLRISDSLRVSRKLKSYIRQSDMDRDSSYPRLEAIIADLATEKDLEDRINRSIISAEEIADEASSTLKNIRREQKRKNAGVRDRLNSIVNSEKFSKYLQDNIVTMREGRYVIPVKQEHKNLIEGIVHDISSSGATAFIEPISVVNLNNELRELEIKEREEIKKILEDLSSLVFQKIESLRYNQMLLEKLDFIFAKGKLALELNGTRPILNNKRYLNIRKARHPLLDPKKVVATDIYMGKEFNTLVITGPNTGGKTVTLKTVGLLTIMAQAGLHIPADFNSEIGIFKDIYADIGDEQSIEQSLSTFSSHMTNIVEILDRVDQDSLVLFDELGAGTDPVEGAALAMSILDNLLKRDIRTMATTHYSQLKVYALTTEGVNNASVEFDVETLSPTYKLLIGVPGKSNAFEISQRLGLQDYIIRNAQSLISKENVDFEDVLQAMEKDRLEAEENRRLSEKYKRDLENLKNELDQEKARIDQRESKIVDRANREARDILRTAKAESEEILREMREISKNVKENRQEDLRKLQDRLKTNIGDIDKDLADGILDVKSKKIPDGLKVGETVRVLTFNQVGEVVEGPDSNGDVLVQVGIMKITAHISTLERARSEEEKDMETRTKHIIRKKAKAVKRSIDLRGLSLDEAILEVDKYLDDAYISRLTDVEIIHGKGSGILRTGITSYLRSHKHVKDFRLGEYGEGGDGVTIVTIK